MVSHFCIVTAQRRDNKMLSLSALNVGWFGLEVLLSCELVCELFPNALGQCTSAGRCRLFCDERSGESHRVWQLSRVLILSLGLCPVWLYKFSYILVGSIFKVHMSSVNVHVQQAHGGRVGAFAPYGLIGTVPRGMLSKRTFLGLSRK